jgi:hypothetical protein
MSRARRKVLQLLGIAALAVPSAMTIGGTANAESRADTEGRAAEAAVALDLGWFPIGGPYLSATPEAVPSGDLVFQLGLDGSAFAHQRVNGVWSGSIPLGGLFNSVVVPAVALNEPPLPFVEAFGVGIDDAMWYWTGGSGWQSLGGAFIFDPTAVTYRGVTYVFGIGIDNAVWYRSTTSGWFTLGGFLDSSLAATTDGTNLYISGVGGDGALWSIQLSPNLTWGSWQSHGGLISSYPVSAYQGGTGYVFGIGVDDAVWYVSVSGGQWSGFQSLGGIALTPAGASADAGGGVDVFVVGQDLAMYSRRLAGGSWSGWQDLGGAFISPPDASQSQVFGIGLDENLWAANYI